MSLRHNVLSLLALAALVACAEPGTEPGRSYPLPAIEPKFVMPPGLTPASFGLVIDTIEVVIEQHDTVFCDCAASGVRSFRTPSQVRAMADTVYADTLVAWPANQESFAFTFEVPPPEPGFAISVTLYMYGQSHFLFYGSSDVDFQRGNIRLPAIPLSYIGPGSGAEDVQLAPGDTALAPGGSLDFVATAYLGGQPVDTSYISWRVSDPTKAQIDHLGHLTLRSGALGSSFLVSATIPNGATAATRLFVPNTVTALQKVSGDSQSAPIGQSTPAPLVVRAVDGTGKPVAGARIRFFPTVVSTFTTSDSVVFTDLQGLARTGAAPTAVGTDTVRAQLTGSALQYDFTATGTASTAIPLLFAADSGASGWHLYRADSSGGNRQSIAFLSGNLLEVTAPRWNPARKRIAFTNYNANSANFDLALTTGIGDTLAYLVTDNYAEDAHFSPTGKMIAFFCGNFGNSLTVGYVCTVDNVDGDLNALNGVGNGTGRTELTALVPGRPNGPSAFAWRPDASTRIAFVRDTAVDSLTSFVSSRFYQTNGDGTSLTTLSPKVMDLGRGPLEVTGGIDWSPDGTTIVFAATDTTNYGAALYLLDVATGAVRRLTTPPYGWNGDYYPRFSPDGQRVLFRRIYYFGGPLDYYVQRTVGSSPTRITYEATNWGLIDPFYLGGDWSPDGLSVAVTGMNGLGGMAAYRVPLTVTSAADYFASRILVGTAGIAGLRDLGVSWGP